MLSSINSKYSSHFGLVFATLILSSWVVSTTLAFLQPLNFYNPFTYLWIIVQMQLFTGLFITAHDAMHGTVSSNPKINNIVGWICTLCYACFFYSKLLKKHHDHHRYVHTDLDPDFSHHNFLIWYLAFFVKYFSWLQYVLLNVLFLFLNLVLKIPQPNLILFWVLPSLLSSLQLFYFGTYAPHRGDPENAHHARSQKKNHVQAFLCCYFFGYHFEHHNAPSVPWWKLYTQKT